MIVAGAEFAAVNGAVLPFGCMEAAISSAGKQAEYSQLLSQVESAEGESLAGVCDAMQRLIMQ